MEFDWNDYLHRQEVCSMKTLILPNDQILHYQELGNITIIRDDLLCGGTKSRYLSKILPIDYDNYVYVGSLWGGLQIALALAVQELNMKYPNRNRRAIIITFQPKGPKGFLPAHPKIAKEFGAELIVVPTTKWSDLEAYGKDFARQHPDTYILPNGMDNLEAHEEIANLGRQIRKHLGIFDQVWSVAGSGSLTRGLQASGLGRQYYAVAVTGGMPNIGNAKGILHPQSFDERVLPENHPPFPSASHYDAKGWQYALNSAQENPDKRILYWNVM